MDKKRAGIIGYGLTGEALLSFLLEDPGISGIIIFDDQEINDSRLPADYKERGIEVVSGEEGITKLSGSDLIIISPGVNGREKRFSQLLKNGAVLMSEMEFASTFIGSGIVAVTGTNGKSTTVSLIQHILLQSGIDSHLAGNIGVPLIAEVSNIKRGDITVLEVSSFQLEEIDKFKPEISAILNITPDHLDRYSTLSNYRETKLNILKNVRQNDPVILNYDDPFLRSRYYSPEVNHFRKLWFSIEHDDFDEGAFLKGDEAVIRLKDLETVISLRGNSLIGSHNIENILASFLAVRILGVSAENSGKALGSFKGLPHRMEVCGEKGEVRYINDSKATNIDATVKSISGINDNLALILGGKDKGGDFSVLKELLDGKIQKIILLGEAADSIAAGIGADKAIFTRVSTLDEAVRKGYSVLAGSGGSVLLAPGCASFDMFRNYEERGDIFKKEVEKFIKEG